MDLYENLITCWQVLVLFKVILGDILIDSAQLRLPSIVVSFNTWIAIFCPSYLDVFTQVPRQQQATVLGPFLEESSFFWQVAGVSMAWLFAVYVRLHYFLITWVASIRNAQAFVQLLIRPSRALILRTNAIDAIHCRVTSDPPQDTSEMCVICRGHLEDDFVVHKGCRKYYHQRCLFIWAATVGPGLNVCACGEPFSSIGKATQLTATPRIRFKTTIVALFAGQLLAAGLVLYSMAVALDRRNDLLAVKSIEICVLWLATICVSISVKLLALVSLGVIVRVWGAPVGKATAVLSTGLIWIMLECLSTECLKYPGLLMDTEWHHAVWIFHRTCAAASLVVEAGALNLSLGDGLDAQLAERGQPVVDALVRYSLLILVPRI